MTIASPTDHEQDQRARLEGIVAANPLFAPFLARWSSIALPDCWLSGSTMAQTGWNLRLGLPPAHGLADIDLVHFDAADLSHEGEAREAQRIRALFADVPLRIDIKNQARVHLWYAGTFGNPIPPYRSIAHAIATLPTTASAVAIRPAADGLAVLAPFGLTDLLDCLVRPNKAQITRILYEAKVAKWRTRWPGLTVLDWDEAA